MLFLEREWRGGYGGKLRAEFKGMLPVPIHDELHHDVLYRVPRPPERLLKKAWAEYIAHPEVKSYSLIRKLAWLYVHIPDAEFRKAIQKQIDFLTLKLGSE